MKLCVIGTGYVGLVTGTIFAEKGHHVICVDNDEKKISLLLSGGIPIYEPGLEELVKRNREAGRLEFTTDIARGVREGAVIFIAVGTPPTRSGKADLSYIEAVALSIAEHMQDYKVIVEKSTVPVETGEKVQRTIARSVRDNIPFDVASNPEFLREGSAIADALKPDRIVIGVTGPRAEKILRELYEPFAAPIIVTDIKSAEIIKHASNSFLALKISYINAVANLCEMCGADVEQVAQGMGLDHRIGTAFLSAGIGYGGSCFPKDVDAFRHLADELDFDFNLLHEVQRINKEQRRAFIRKVEKELWIVKGKKVAVLGLAFKPETDDMREAPAIDIISHLHEEGALVTAYDPVAMAKAREVLPPVSYATDPYAALRDADCALLLTEWQEFRDLDWARARTLMRHPVLLDGRNLFSPSAMRELGFTYRSIGRK